MTLVALTYASRTAPGLDEAALARLRDAAARRNAAAGVASVLLHAADSFLHLLEGDERAVVKTFNRIDADPRHRGVTVVDWRFLVDRAPGLESLAYVRVEPTDEKLQPWPRLRHGFDGAWLSNRPDVLRVLFACYAPGTTGSFPGFGGR